MEKYYLVKVDKKGRIVIPKEIRDKTNTHGRVRLVNTYDIKTKMVKKLAAL
jgi:AbrB family looped-hinge helix DNA binding protein